MDIVSHHGHSMVSMAFYGLLLYCIFKYIENRIIKITLCVLLTITIFIIGFSRIYLGVHYASDVLGGFCLAMAYLSIFTKYARKHIDQGENK